MKATEVHCGIALDTSHYINALRCSLGFVGLLSNEVHLTMSAAEPSGRAVSRQVELSTDATFNCPSGPLHLVAGLCAHRLQFRLGARWSVWSLQQVQGDS